MKWENLLSMRRGKELMGGTYKPSKPDYDVRTEIERDYGRAVFSTAVRRLQDKAQVFPLEPNDFVRTRLTHSLEVSGLSRSLAAQVARQLAKEGKLPPDQVSAVETVAATAGLLHDIGNPPFGHTGEDAIRDWFEVLFGDNASLVESLGGSDSQLCKDFRLFEGNAQTLRLIARLQVLADRHGLNLTAATLSAACKYVAASDDVADDNHQRSKPGYFASEQKLVEILRQETGTGDARNPITYLVEAADDMTYTTVDLEDAVRKGIISWEFLRETCSKADPSLSTLFDRCEEYLKKGDSVLSGRSVDEAKVQLFRTFAMYEHVAAAADEFHRAYDEIMNGTYQKELLAVGRSGPLLAACKTIGRKNVYNSPAVVRLEIAGKNAIHRLMDAFWDGVKDAPRNDPKWKRSFPGKTYSLMSESYRRIFEEDVEIDRKDTAFPIEYRRLQLVADYVAGMTDTFAISLAHELGLGA